MVNIELPDNLYKDIENIAHKKGLSIPDLLSSFVNNFKIENLSNDTFEKLLENSIEDHIDILNQLVKNNALFNR